MCLHSHWENRVQNCGWTPRPSIKLKLELNPLPPLPLRHSMPPGYGVWGQKEERGSVGCWNCKRGIHRVVSGMSIRMPIWHLRSHWDAHTFLQIVTGDQAQWVLLGDSSEVCVYIKALGTSYCRMRCGINRWEGQDDKCTNMCSEF